MPTGVTISGTKKSTRKKLRAADRLGAEEREAEAEHELHRDADDDVEQRVTSVPGTPPGGKRREQRQHKAAIGARGDEPADEAEHGERRAVT